jgi:thiol-disulfide isomerase/thioredoxin
MSRFSLRVSGAVLLCGSLAATIAARGDDPSVAAILKEIEAIRMPDYDASRREDEEYRRRYNREKDRVQRRKAELIGALYRADPENPELATLLPERWKILTEIVNRSRGTKVSWDLIAELNDAIARAPSVDMKKEAAYWKAYVASLSGQASPATVAAIDAFIALDRKDERGAELLFDLGSSLDRDPARQKALYTRVINEYPDSSSARTAQGALRRAGAVGLPFELEFTEATTGALISMKNLRGKVVVIDFWATWCGPCVASMPAMKRLYAQYKDKGVEFIGVNLDDKQRGLEKLRAFVAKEGIAWPQYFQGDGFESPFSTSWGINAIPTVFLIDQEGKVVSVEADDQLETLIPELLSRRFSRPEGDGGR